MRRGRMSAFKLIGCSMVASLCFATATVSAATTRNDYNAAKERAAVDFKAADARCASLSGNPKDICQAEAKLARKKAEVTAEADYKNTPGARQEAAEEIAEAEYSLAKERCDAKTGNEKDVCVKEAKAAQTRMKADAKATEKSTVARRDASEDKRDADYKVAMAKCDGMAGNAKDTCQRSAKASFGK